MTREHIDTLIGAIPRSTVDVDGIITREARRRRRRIGASAGGVAACALGVAVTLLVANLAGGLNQGAAPSGPSTIYYSDGTVLATFGPSTAPDLAGPVGLVVNQVFSELTHTPGSLWENASWDTLRTSALEITTTIDRRAQAQLEATVARQLDGQPPNLQAAGVVVEPGTGRVLAYYGGDLGTGSDYASVYLDEQGEAVGFGRHPAGGTFMAYTLAAALRQGYSVNSYWQWLSHPVQGRDPGNPIRNSNDCGSDLLTDASGQPVVGYIRNADGSYSDPGLLHRSGSGSRYLASSGLCSLLESVRKSLAVPLYDVAANLGVVKLAQLVCDAGIETLWNSQDRRVDLRQADLSNLSGEGIGPELGIGQYAVTVLDQANAMATFAAGGLRADAHFIRAVRQGDAVAFTETLPGSGDARVLTDVQSADLTYTLNDGQLEGVASKTGAWELAANSSDNGDAWSIGYTSALAAAVWIGNRGEALPLVDSNGRKIYGSGLPRSILAAVIAQTQTELGLHPAPFPAPAFTGDENPPGSYPKP